MITMGYVWFAVEVALLLIYVMLDGYDLGIGVLSLFQKDKQARHDMVEEVADIWDGNETWLVLIGLGLWGGRDSFGALARDRAGRKRPTRNESSGCRQRS